MCANRKWKCFLKKAIKVKAEQESIVDKCFVRKEKAKRDLKKKNEKRQKKKKDKKDKKRKKKEKMKNN